MCKTVNNSSIVHHKYIADPVGIEPTPPDLESGILAVETKDPTYSDFINFHNFITISWI